MNPLAVTIGWIFGTLMGSLPGFYLTRYTAEVTGLGSVVWFGYIAILAFFLTVGTYLVYLTYKIYYRGQNKNQDPEAVP